jgi:hypothetical protein
MTRILEGQPLATPEMVNEVYYTVIKKTQVSYRIIFDQNSWQFTGKSTFHSDRRSCNDKGFSPLDTKATDSGSEVHQVYFVSW